MWQTKFDTDSALFTAFDPQSYTFFTSTVFVGFVVENVVLEQISLPVRFY
jgi:hypothetical protein